MNGLRDIQNKIVFLICDTINTLIKILIKISWAWWVLPSKIGCVATPMPGFFLLKSCDMVSEKINAAGLVVSGSKNPNWKGGKIELNCIICNKAFKVKQCHKNAKYCSLQCVGVSQRGKSNKVSTKVTKICEVCLSEFITFKAHSERQKCCSKKCSYKRRSIITKGEMNPSWCGGLSRLPYVYNWNFISKKIRERDGNKCMNNLCTNKDGKGKIEVHHIDHNKENNSSDNLITLCSVCNSKANFNRDYWVSHYKIIIESKIKTAAAKFPFRFISVRLKKGEWEVREF